MAITWAGAEWLAGTAYGRRARVIRNGNVYQCITAGTSAASGGPTGTSSDITDGSVHWNYLGEDSGAVVDLVPDVADVTEAQQAVLLALAETLVSDTTVWLDLLDDGRRYMAGHLAQLARLQGHGAVTSEGVGELSRSYVALDGDETTAMTSAGRAFQDLVRCTVAVLGSVL